MTSPFTPDKELSGPSFRAIEQWELDHEGTKFVTSAQLNASAARGRNVFNTDDGLYYVYDGAIWRIRPGQLIGDGSGGKAIYSLGSNGPQSADAVHDSIISAPILMPNLPSGNRVLLEVSCPGFVYAVDPGANAVFEIQITDNTPTVISGAKSVFVTGQPFAGGVVARRSITNSTIAAGAITLRIRVASTDATQAYGTYGAAARPLVFSATVV